jgi:GntR family transcriptional regulator, transcriptional repressor for pyruvate dehydrogenase complex
MMDIVPTVSKADYVAQQLLDRIVSSGLAAGSTLGTESELLDQFNVSRPTLREGLRILESYGVLEFRPGPGGGIMMRKPSIDVLAHWLSVHLRLHEVPFIDVLKVREIIEPALAAEAALNGSEEDFNLMAESIERMRSIKDQTEFIEENRIFHFAVAAASGNQVLEIFWTAISMLAAGDDQGVKYSPNNQQHIIDAHAAILKACRARNSKVASESMASHLGELEDLVRKKYKNLVSKPTRIFAKQGRR